LAFVLQYAIGANSTFSLTAVFTGMMSTHVLIGIGEAVITGFSVTAVMASRPDLVYGYRGTKHN
jgi:cobalt/nickel transport system permease protein